MAEQETDIQDIAAFLEGAEATIYEDACGELYIQISKDGSEWSNMPNMPALEQYLAEHVPGLNIASSGGAISHDTGSYNLSFRTDRSVWPSENPPSLDELEQHLAAALNGPVEQEEQSDKYCDTMLLSEAELPPKADQADNTETAAKTDLDAVPLKLG